MLNAAFAQLSRRKIKSDLYYRNASPALYVTSGVCSHKSSTTSMPSMLEDVDVDGNDERGVMGVLTWKRAARLGA
jgi:hypothetical protein